MSVVGSRLATRNTDDALRSRGVLLDQLALFAEGFQGALVEVHADDDRDALPAAGHDGGLVEVAGAFDRVGECIAHVGDLLLVLLLRRGHSGSVPQIRDVHERAYGYDVHELDQGGIHEHEARMGLVPRAQEPLKNSLKEAPMPYPETLKLDFDTLFAEVIDQVDNRTLGLLIRSLAWAATHKRTYVPIGVMQACGSHDHPEDLVTLQQGGFIGELDKVVYPLLPNAWRLCNVGRMPLPRPVRTTVLARDGHRCVTCAAAEHLQVDHIFPVALGGGDEIENLRTLCRSCNSSKGARV